MSTKPLASVSQQGDPLKISEKYLEALKTVDGWVTALEWAKRVGETYPDILENANRQAAGQANPTTGLHELRARISSNVARGAYEGHIDIDTSERPARFKYLKENETPSFIKKEMEEEEEELTRSEIEDRDYQNLSIHEQYRHDEFYAVAKAFKDFFQIDCDVDHAKALMNPNAPGKNHPDNLQILLARHNRSKNHSNWERFSIEKQIQYLSSAIETQKLVAKQFGQEIDEKVVEQLFNRLRLVFS